MTDEMLRKLAPLLAEGIDLSGDDVPDVDTLQAAPDRAVERRNLELFSPSARPRQVAVDTLGQVVVAVLVSDGSTAGKLLVQVQPDSPDNTVATVFAGIDIALGLLDDTHASPRAPTVALPAGHGQGERAARDILALA